MEEVMNVVGIGARKKKFDVPTKNARKIAEIIRDGVKFMKNLEVIKGKIEETKQRIIPYAENLAGISGQKTVAFKSVDGQVKVVFGDQIIYKEKDIMKIKAILGPLFDTAFTCTTTFAVNLVDIPEIKKKLGKDFDRLIQEQKTHKHKQKLRDLLSDGDSEVSKQLREVILIEAKSPSITFERAGA
jgi:hypothetical protein